MGNQGSKGDAPLPEEDVPAAQPGPPSEVKLYRYESQAWTLANPSVDVDFLNELEAEGVDPTKWYLIVNPGVCAQVSEAAQADFNAQQKKVTFFCERVWALKFRSASKFEEFSRNWDAKLFENKHGLEATEENKAKVFGEEFLDTYISGKDGAEVDFEAMDAEDAPPPKLKQTLGGQLARGEKAQYLEVGAAMMSYLLHGSGVDVYRNVEDGVKDTGMRLQVKDTGGGMSTPSKGLLAKGERELLLISPATKLTPSTSKYTPAKHDRVYQMDIEKEKVVAEWKYNKDGVELNMNDIVGDCKSAQLEHRSTFLGLEDNRLCRWDMRDKHGAVQDLTYSTGKDYARGTNFRCMATTGDGSIAVGASDGKVRLYNDRVLTRAKTAFPGLGDPITSIDATYDASWVLATTNHYLLLIYTLFTDKKSGKTNAFSASMGRDKVAAPRMLRLKASDIPLLGTAPFKDARFSWVTQEGTKERYIAASVGKATLVWNFNHVKKHHGCYDENPHKMKTCKCYQIVNEADLVVASRFAVDEKLLIATEDVVYNLAIDLEGLTV
eukprot:jgi/Mesvir1/21610/Mv04036-RA.1